jgi:hypothetical protein
MEECVRAVMAAWYNQVGISTPSGCVSDRGEQSGGVRAVETGDGVAQADLTAARRADHVSLGIPAYRDITAATLTPGDLRDR